jgi:hypothetical protein
VVIDLKKNKSLWEDFYDRVLIESRKNESKFSLEETKTLLKAKGKL